MVIALISFLIEILVWWLSREGQVRSWVRRQSAAGVLSKVASNVRLRVSRQESTSWMISPKIKLREILDGLFGMSAKDRTALLILRPLDILASIWLAYIVTAQTFGSYQSCG